MMFVSPVMQSAMCQTLALLLPKMEWWTQDVMDSLGAAYTSPMVWSATMELLHFLRQSTSVMIILILWVKQEGSARVMATGMGAYLSASCHQVGIVANCLHSLHEHAGIVVNCSNGV